MLVVFKNPLDKVAVACYIWSRGEFLWSVAFSVNLVVVCARVCKVVEVCSGCGVYNYILAFID